MKGFSLRRQRTVLILEKHFVAAVRFQTVAGENLSLVFQINALDKLWAAKHFVIVTTVISFTVLI